MVGTNDLAASLAFYDAVFAPLGYRQTDDSGRYVGYGWISRRSRCSTSPVPMTGSRRQRAMAP